MKEIKFRAWDKVLWKMVYTDFWDRNWYRTPTNDEHGCHTMYDKQSIKYECEVMQYTGLKDKNGKEIYEGDIIRLHEGINVAIGWNNETCAFCALPNGKGIPSDHLYAGEYTEVIGNIYENPELLKEV